MTQTHRRGFLRRGLGAGLGCCAGRELIAPAGAVEGPKRLRVVPREGPPWEWGVTHGKALKDATHAILGIWKAALAERYGMDGGAFIGGFPRRTNSLPAMKRWTP